MGAEGEVSERRVVHLAFPYAPDHPGVADLRRIDPGVEILHVAYRENHARRSARATMSAEERRRSAPPLGDEQLGAFARADVILALETPLDLDRIAPRLRWMHIAAAGIEHLAGSRLAVRDVLVTNSSGVAAPSIAEFVLGRLLAVWKRFDEIDRQQREHRWATAYGRTFAGSVIAIVGAGAVGAAVARLAKAFGATVIGIRRSAVARADFDEMHGPEALHAVLGRADAVVLGAPGGSATRGLIGSAELAAMKPGAVLCNVARGSLIDEAALADAMRRGHLKAAILDVFEEEPLPPESPLWDLPGVWISPHASTSLDRYADDVMALFVDNYRRYRNGEPLSNRVVAPD